jgi:hypothetical protein
MNINYFQQGWKHSLRNKIKSSFTESLGYMTSHSLRGIPASRNSLSHPILNSLHSSQPLIIIFWELNKKKTVDLLSYSFQVKKAKERFFRDCRMDKRLGRKKADENQWAFTQKIWGLSKDQFWRHQ